MAPRALARRRDDRRPRFSPLFLLLLLLSLTMIGSQSGTGWGVAHAQAGGSTFKVAFWNIQSGHGEHPLPGRTCGFTENGNCTDASLPLNGWGMHMVQDELVQEIRNDPAVIALGLAEAWNCATPAAVQQVLGWAARSTAKGGGVALLAKYGFAGAEEWIQLDTSQNIDPSDMKFALRVPVCLDAACTRTVTVYVTHLYANSVTDAAKYAGYVTQAGQLLDFTARTSGITPHLVMGDFNAP